MPFTQEPIVQREPLVRPAYLLQVLQLLISVRISEHSIGCQLSVSVSLSLFSASFLREFAPMTVSSILYLRGAPCKFMPYHLVLLIITSDIPVK